MVGNMLGCCARRANLSFIQVSRPIAIGPRRYANSSSSVRTKPDWDRAVHEAERVVGYPTSFANLRWLMSDEVANVALHLRKLVGSEHPILKTAKNLLYGGKNNLQSWGLLILLISKAAGHKSPPPPSEQMEEGGLFQSQRTLAEITEMIRTGHLVHKGLINLSLDQPLHNKEDMFFGNKIALLTGDYLLVTANGMLSNLRNQHLSELISSALRDLTDGEFIGERNSQNIAIPSKPVDGRCEAMLGLNDDSKIYSLIGSCNRFQPLNTSDCVGTPVREWTMRSILAGGSLLGKGCEGALHLANHDKVFQNKGYLFGCHAALAWQAFVDYKLIAFSRSEPFSLVSAPVLFALDNDPSLYDQIECAKDDIDKVDYEALREAIKSGPALENTMALHREHSEAAIRTLEDFPNSDAVKALKNMVLAINEQ